MKKLRVCLINKIKDELINIISSKSDRYGDKLIDFLDRNNLISLKDATVEQLQNYISNYLQIKESDNLKGELK
jgi:hypothetical protein